MLIVVIYSLLTPWTWIGLVLAFIAGLIQLGRRPMLVGLLGFFGIQVILNYVSSGIGITPWPYIMGLVAVVFAIIAHMVGLALSALLPSAREKKGRPTP
jgi:hypothetical protein